MITKKDIIHIPSHAGVYYFWEGKTPIYIGKAANLKARLTSHLQNATIDRKEANMVKRADRITFSENLNEFDALLTEARLISQYLPFYNVRLRDDKSYLYIKVTKRQKYPKIYSVRRENDHLSLYFGPFESSRIVRFILANMRKIIPYCTQKQIAPYRCFYSKIGLCNPCPNLIEKETDLILKEQWQKQYRTNINQIIAILSGRSDKVIILFEKKLRETIANNNFEDGIVIRNKLLLFKKMLTMPSVSDSLTPEIDNLKKTKQNLKRFIHTLNPMTKRRGGKLRLEAFDISTLFGKQTTASMVVFENGLGVKGQYRRFKIRMDQPSDVGAIGEVILRRFKKNGWTPPDLIIIDGGKPQLIAASKALKKLHINIPIIGLAKKPDRVLDGKTMKPIPFERGDLLFRLFQEMRDESHRFAKQYHLLLRGKKLYQ